MTHRAEVILSKIKENLMSMPSIGGRVYRDQVLDIKATPAVTIDYLGEELVSELSTDLSDWRMFLNLNIHVKQAEGFSTAVNRIRAEITAALMKSPTQGIAFIIDTKETDVETPEQSFDSQKPTIKQPMGWEIMYRRKRSVAE